MDSRARNSTLRAVFLLLAWASSPVSAGGEPPSSAASPSADSPAPARERHVYAFFASGERLWEAGNVAQGLRVSVSGEGARLLPEPSLPSSWEWGMSLLRHGIEGRPWSSGAAYPAATGERVDLLRGSLREWYRNSPAGIEHGLEIPAGPEGTFYGRLEYALEGNLTPKVSEDGQKIVFRDGSGRAVLLYLDLRGEDAAGREVSTRWERVEHGEDSGPVLRLILLGADLSYPLRIGGRLVTPKGAIPKGDTARLAAGEGVLTSPANDLCSGAEVLPAAGPFPYLSPVFDLTDAGTAGDPPVPSCQASLSRSVWFAFTPAETASYSFSVCADAPTATTLEDTVLAVYAASGDCSGLSEEAGGCSDDSCGPTGLQSSVQELPLTAGTRYYIVTWSYGTTAPPPGAASLQLQVVRNPASGPPPPNDLCSGAEVIPGGGPFPYLTAVTADVGGATTAGDPPAPSCQPNVSRSIWYSFTPAASGRYGFSSCADAPTGTTADDTVLAVYSATGDCAGWMELPGECDDDSCVSEMAQSMLSGVSLSAGTTYYVVVWQYGTIAPSVGDTAVQLRVSQLASPPNDTCAAPEALSLDFPVAGTTVSASDDIRIAHGSSCFTGVGQTSSAAEGNDVVYRFTAEEAGRYSFRLGGYDSSKNAVLYVAADCPEGSSPAPVTQCLGAANRTPNSPEEVICLPLGAEQSVFVYVDEDMPSSGSLFTLEATRCAMEEEANESPVSAGEISCGIEGSVVPAGDADFFSLGVPEPDSRVFAIAEGAAANTTDFDLRVTTETDTLEYDDFNNDIPFGSAAPNVEGTRLDGAPAFLRVSHYSPAAQAEPYRLYATVRPPALLATGEAEPNDTLVTATWAANEYFSGTLSGAGDVDIFSFTAAAGEVIQIGLDLDPERDKTPFNGSLALLDSSGATLLQVNDPSAGSSIVPGTGTLAGPSPYSPGEGMISRIRASGTYYVKVAWSSGTPGDYLLSVSHDCRILPATDLRVFHSAAPDPVPPGGAVTYTIRVDNAGPETASGVVLRDDLPQDSTLVSATASQGTCAGTGPVVCRLESLGAGTSATVEVVAGAPIPPGPITNVARVSSWVVDTLAANDVAGATTMVEWADSDGDGVADATDCAPGDGAFWAVPGEAAGLLFPLEGDTGFLQWSLPASPGGTMVLFDLLRSEAADDFQSSLCLASDSLATNATDSELPGGTFFYLVSSENPCGTNLGSRSDGTPRIGGSCP